MLGWIKFWRKSVPEEALPPTEPTQLRDHLQQYLDFYKERKKPGYAVLVTGEWGVGKSYQVRNALTPEERVYVSLFGLQTVADLDFSVFAATNPTPAKIKKWLSGLGDVSAEVDGWGGGAIGGLLNGLGNVLIRQKVDNSKVIIFDDLERCSIPVEDTLGAINRYVEHEDCRVIVIAHDEEIAKKFEQSKEKVFGQTIRVEPNVEAAYTSFATLLEGVPGNEVISAHRIEIIDTFRESKAVSLRILRHIMEDVCRLNAGLTDDHRNNKDAISNMIRLFSALNIEVRRHKLLPDDLRSRPGKGMRDVAGTLKQRQNEQPKEIPFVTAAEKYKKVDLTDYVLNDEVLINALFIGVYDHAQIRASIDASKYFLKDEDHSAWRIFINFDLVGEEMAERAKQKLMSQFDNREVKDIGEMLHVFSLRMMWAQHGFIDQNISEVVADCKKYVHDLLEKGELPPTPLGNNRDGGDAHFLYRSSHGYGYWIDDVYKTEWAELVDYVVAARKEALERTYPIVGKTLLKLVETDGAGFQDMVCPRNGPGPLNYSYNPVLAAISPEEFVAAWLRSPAQNWRKIEHAFLWRYDESRLWLQSAIIVELPWLKRVLELWKAEAEKAQGLTRLRIERAYPTDLDGIISRLEEAQNQAPKQSDES